MYTGRDQQDTKIQLNPLVSLLAFQSQHCLLLKESLRSAKECQGFFIAQ